MGAAERDKGARAEVALVNWLRDNGYPDARRYFAGDGRQPGDIDGVPGVAFEVKNCSTLRLGEWLRQARAQAGSALPVVVVKPRGTANPGEWFAVMRLEDLLGEIR